MCEYGTDVEVADLLAFNGEWHRRTWKIDSCIAPIIQALNLGGVETSQSCCGHGKGPGRIDLADGRILSIAESSLIPLSAPKPERALFVDNEGADFDD